ncbi:Protein CBR-SRD-41 [Caenorhabditis briggsae]|uniref:Protein CBR-SRD-41 n=1 Tax=Caenorhabditis briggsae TaxID=6238 RepID=A8WZJ5_CAEBR|nr:Protein CBR-SRD-41 [Caenorhabditis briggsae]CAP25805.2 Protein CBR-SRD-41 [Caenorhabditis briggsae]
MPSSETYLTFLFFFYPILALASWASQCLTNFFILRHTPKFMEKLKYVMINTSVFQTAHVSVCWLMQFRQVSNADPIQIWSYGLGKYFPAHIGYMFYHIMQTCTFASGISVVISLFLKYQAVRLTPFDPKWRKFVLFLIILPLIISVTMEVVLIVDHSLPLEIREHYEQLNLSNEQYTIVGVIDFLIWPSTVNTSVMVLSVFMFPVVGLLSLWKMRKLFKRTSDRVSAIKNTQRRLFLIGLVIQTFLPLIFYCPISLVYFYCIRTKEEILLQQYFMFTLPACPALIDPYITLYFVKPYRDTIKNWFTIRLGTEKAVIVSPATKNSTLMIVE